MWMGGVPIGMLMHVLGVGTKLDNTTIKNIMKEACKPLETMPYTEFEGKLGKQQVYYEKYYLDDYEGFYKTFFNYVNWTRTKTDSKTISGGEVEVYIVTGWQP
jgi:hypothetical protein